MSKKLVDTGGLCIYQFVGARRRRMIGIQVGSREVTMTAADFAAVLTQAAAGLGIQVDTAAAGLSLQVDPAAPGFSYLPGPSGASGSEA